MNNFVRARTWCVKEKGGPSFGKARYSKIKLERTVPEQYLRAMPCHHAGYSERIESRPESNGASMYYIYILCLFRGSLPTILTIHIGCLMLYFGLQATAAASKYGSIHSNVAYSRT
jgi:hypothetical protein